MRSLTQASYCGADARLMNWTCRPCEAAGFHLVPGSLRFVQRRELEQPNSTFVLLARLAVVKAHFSAGCVVSFRGSETITNWLEDFRFWNRATRFDWCDGCYVEDGFSVIWRSVNDELVEKLRDIGCVANGTKEQSTLYITGHSLGAAVGTLAMCGLQSMGFNVSLSYLFESPRVGNLDFAQAFDDEFVRRIPMYRITHAQDPVVHLPPRDLLGYKYRHVNYEVFYDKEGSWRFCPEAEDRNCADRYSLVTSLMHTGDHCATPLAPNGTICHCPVGRKGEPDTMVI